MKTRCSKDLLLHQGKTFFRDLSLPTLKRKEGNVLV